MKFINDIISNLNKDKNVEIMYNNEDGSYILMVGMRDPEFKLCSVVNENDLKNKNITKVINRMKKFNYEEIYKKLDNNGMKVEYKVNDIVDIKDAFVSLNIDNVEKRLHSCTNVMLSKNKEFMNMSEYEQDNFLNEYGYQYLFDNYNILNKKDYTLEVFINDLTNLSYWFSEKGKIDEVCVVDNIQKIEFALDTIEYLNN